jgi:hypothetical protein
MSYNFGKQIKKEVKMEEDIEKDSPISILYIPYNVKDDAKRYGAKFDYASKIWFVEKSHINHDVLKNLYSNTNYDIYMRTKDKNLFVQS